MSILTVLLIVLAGILSAGLAMGQYYFGKRQASWLLFLCFRFITYFAVFLLLINPKFKQRSYTVKKPVLVFAIDNSRSIEEFGEGENVRSFVDQLKADKSLNKRFDIQTYTFGNDFEAGDSLSFSEGQTNISSVFSNLGKLYKSQMAPTVLITDGNQTLGENYTLQAQNYAQPLYPVVVGDTNTYVDLKIEGLNVNRYAFLHNKFPVEIFVNYDGGEAVSKKLTISQEGQILFSKVLHFDHGKSSAVVDATLKANRVGVRTYEAKIAPLKKEKNTVNNTRKFALEVMDQKTNVLLLASAPHPDLGAFKKSIEHIQQRQADIKYVGKDDIDFGKYQLVVLYQPNSKFKRAFEQINQLKINTFIITGTDTDYNFLNQNQPFFYKEITKQTEDYLPTYNSGYSSFQFENIDFDDFPPLKDKFGEIKMKTEYQTLLFQNIDGFQRKTPLLATLELGKNRYGLLFGENSWKWRAKSFRDTGSFKTYDEFVGKLLQYLSSNKRRERLSVDFKSYYNSGEAIVFRAHYFDDNYQFDPRAKLSIELRNKDTKKSQHMPFLLKSERYESNLSNLQPGDYKFTVKADGKNLSKSGEFTVVDFDIEKQFLNANIQKLKKLSDQGLYFLDQKEKLFKTLLANDNYKPVQKEQLKTSSLIDWWYLLIIIVLSLSSEWFMRKYKGLI